MEKNFSESGPRLDRKKEGMKKILEEAINGCIELLKGEDGIEKDAELIAPIISSLRKLQEGI